MNFRDFVEENTISEALVLGMDAWKDELNHRSNVVTLNSIKEITKLKKRPENIVINDEVIYSFITTAPRSVEDRITSGKSPVLSLSVVLCKSKSSF